MRSMSSSCIRCCIISMTARARSRRPRACCAFGGRLLVVDFAPHDLEFLREEHAHRRLGFSPPKWCRDGSPGGPRRRHAQDASRPSRARIGKLTVSLWLAQDTAHSADRRPARRSHDEPHERRCQPLNGAARIRVSFEFFPPKTAEMERTLWDAIDRLAPLRRISSRSPMAPAARPASAPCDRQAHR